MNTHRKIFTTLSFGLFLAFAQFAGAEAEAQQVADPRIADLVEVGQIRVGVGLSVVGATKDPATGELRGVAMDIARAAMTGSRALMLDLKKEAPACAGAPSLFLGFPFRLFCFLRHVNLQWLEETIGNYTGGAVVALKGFTRSPQFDE